MPNCLNKKCPAVARYCGLCTVCYHQVVWEIRTGKVTREEAERRGRILPGKKKKQLPSLVGDLPKR